MADIFSQPTDQDALRLTHSIALAESGSNGKPNYNAVGDAGTSKGAYQWQPGNYEAAAKEAGLDPNDFSPANQDKVAYSQVKKYKDEGLDPGQIASKWNSGSPNNWQNHSGTVTINGQQVHYDTPAYVKKVQGFYKGLQGAQPLTSNYNPAPYSSGAVNLGKTVTTPDAQNAPPQSFLSKAGQDTSSALTGTAKALTDTASGKINPISGILQGAGSIASGVSNVTNDALTHIPLIGGLIQGGENLIGKGAVAAANTGAGKAVTGAYQSFATAHPELAGDIGAAANIAGVLPIFKGLSIAKDAASAGLEGALKGSADAVYDTVAPKLSAKETAEAISKFGTTNKGLLRTTSLNPTPYVQNIADTVKAYVPNFNPSDELTNNISKVQNVVNKMSSDLKQQVIQSGSDRIYPFKELASRLNNIEKPVLVSSDATLNNAYKNVINKALDIAKSNGGKVSNLLDTRQELDSWLGKQFPNLYSSDTLTPLRQAVKDVRNTITDFTADNLPKEVGLKANLLTQHKLISAVENMSEKAASGASKEIGTTALTRLAKRHPLISSLIKTGGKAAAEGAGFGAITKII